MTPLGSLARTILVAVVTLALIGGISFWLARARPKSGNARAGRVGPHRGLVLLSVIAGVVVSGLITYFALTNQTPGAHAVVAAGVFALTLACTTSLTPIYDLVWTDDGIEGPTSLWFPPLGPKRRRLAWSELTNAGMIGGFWFVENRDGVRLRWNYTYGGRDMLVSAIRMHSPWLVVALTDA